MLYIVGETKLVFSYEVEWHASEVRWASRWDIYLAMRDVQIHWFSIINSVVVVFFLSGMLCMISSLIATAVLFSFVHVKKKLEGIWCDFLCYMFMIESNCGRSCDLA